MNAASFWEGYVVQRTASAPSYYNGAASAEVWPLASIAGQLASDLTRQVTEFFYGYDEQGRYRLWTVPSAVLVAHYLQACTSLNVDVRLLVCTRSERESKSMTEDAGLKTLGWDVVSPSLSSSLIDLEVLSDDPTLRTFSNTLNANGLFDSLDQLREYRRFRQALIDAGEDLEDARRMYDVFLAERIADP